MQGTTSRPLADGATTPPSVDVRSVAFIPRNAGTGGDFLTLNVRLSRTFRIGNAVKLDGLVEAFNIGNRINNLTRNSTWGPGAYPSSPVPAFNGITAVGDPRSLQFGLRVTF